MAALAKTQGLRQRLPNEAARSGRTGEEGPGGASTRAQRTERKARGPRFGRRGDFQLHVKLGPADPVHPKLDLVGFGGLGLFEFWLSVSKCLVKAEALKVHQPSAHSNTVAQAWPHEHPKLNGQNAKIPSARRKRASPTSSAVQ